jgi:ribosomal protein L24E
MDDVRVFGYCENCGEEVTDNYDEYYVSDDGKVFCSIECICESFGLTKVEV